MWIISVFICIFATDKSEGNYLQVTHYYPYSSIIDDIRTNKNVQKYKFEGKKLDRIFDLDNYDIYARQNFAMAPMWDKTDSKP